MPLVIILILFNFLQGYTKDCDTSDTPATFTNSLGMTFNRIKAGTFTMGSTSDEPGRRQDEALHQVTLPQNFYMQTTEVTQEQWWAVMGNYPSYFTNCGNDCPVEKVSWCDVQNFIEALNAMREGTYRLPTESEWEYACRAGSATAFTNGKITQTDCRYDANLDQMGWYCGNSDVTYGGCVNGSWLGGSTCAGTHPVAQKQPNAWGLYDMHGNVWEWCLDWYDEYPSGSVTDPAGPSSGSFRVSRGGGWNSYAQNCRSTHRGDCSLGNSSYLLGFRLVCLQAGQ